MKLSFAVSLVATVVGLAAAVPYHPLQNPYMSQHYNYAAGYGHHPHAATGGAAPRGYFNRFMPTQRFGFNPGALIGGTYDTVTAPLKHLGGVLTGGEPGPVVPPPHKLVFPPLPKPQKPVPLPPVVKPTPEVLPATPPPGTGSSPGWYTLLHGWLWTTYVTWSYTGHPYTGGLTWGIQCKGEGCQTKTGFVGFKDSDHSDLLDLHASSVGGVGSTEYSTQYGKVFCPEQHFMTSMNCKDLACTSMELVCAPLKPGLRAIYSDRWGGVWDDDYQRVYCKEGEYIDGIECVGSCTKSFNIFCSKVESLGHY